MDEKRWSYLAVTTSFIVAWFAVTLQFGVGALNPGFPDWFMVPGADWTQHYFGWVYYRFGAWHWPPGTLTGYAYPMVSSMGYTDAIPLVAMPLKVLSPWLPEPFQYIGWWLFTCFALQTWFGYRLLRVLSAPPAFAWLGSIFLGMSPTLLFRDGHPALCAHWVITALWWSYFNTAGKHNLRQATVITALSAWIHPYLTAMALALYLVILLKQSWIDRKVSISKALIFAATMLGWTLLSFYLIGYFNLEGTQQGGLGVGEFSANLNTWFNPHTESAFWQGLPWAETGQYEGYGYLGTAVIVLIALFLIHRLSTRKGPLPSTRSGWLALLTGITLFLFALSPRWTFFNHTIFQYETQISLFQTFRSTGRFIWPLYYLILGWTIAKIAGWWSAFGWKGWIALSLFLAIQLAEFGPKLPNEVVRHEPFQSPLPHVALWDTIFLNSQHIWIYPPYNNRIRDAGDDMAFMEIGARTHRPISEGGLARRDDRMAYEVMDTLTARIHGQGRFAAGDIMIMSPEILAQSDAVFLEKGSAYLLDDYLVYIPHQSDPEGTIQRFLRGKNVLPVTSKKILRPEQIFAFYPGDYVLFAIKDEATEGMAAATKTFFVDHGSWLGKILFQSSYAGIWRDSLLLKEESAKLKAVQLDTLLAGTSIHLESAGMPSGNFVHIQVNDEELATQDRGLHVVILNREGKVVTTGYGDLYQSRYLIMRSD